MPRHDYQRHAFLGGEVSPSLYERADMEKFSRWFSKAENIRFQDTGGFRNRPGFVKIADTKRNMAGDVIKLLSFSFNDEESFLVELGNGYARFFRNGKPVMDGEDVYELATDLINFSEEDIKYTQAGDIIFIVHPKSGIFELARLNPNGSAWNIKRYNANCLPMLEENDDKEKTISCADYAIKVKRCSVENVQGIYKDVSFTFDGNLLFQANNLFLKELILSVQENVGDSYEVKTDGDYLTIISKDLAQDVPNFTLVYTVTGYEERTVSAYGENGSATWVSASVDVSQFRQLKSIYVKARESESDYFEGTKIITADSITASMELAAGFGSFSQHRKQGGVGSFSSSGVTTSYSTNRFSYICNFNNGSHDLRCWITVTGNIYNTGTYTRNSFEVSAANEGYYTLTSPLPVFKDVEADEKILLKNAKDVANLYGSYTTSQLFGPYISDGSWRTYSVGNWAGQVTLQYSIDNKQTWTDYYTWSSENTDQPYNFNTSGSLETSGVVWFRVSVNVTAGTIRFFFATQSFDINSYYQVLMKESDYSVVVKCVKNDVGTFSNNYKWRKQVFSNNRGWPQVVSFYQNRLFFGKDYILYGSKTDSFWDFYEPIQVSDDDPITISLLSTKVNDIKNIETQRSFFTFTSGGEFAIGSEGALTQKDKYLKQFGSNGSASCTPVLISDVILFVDKSYNSVRALKYSLEADGYEAPDVSITLRYLLRNEKIISTDHIFEEKEALFLSDTGIIWVLKYITDQNILSWSHWKHAFGKITNICVVPNGHKHDLYIIVEYAGKKWIEKLDNSNYTDTTETFEGLSTQDFVTVTGAVEGDKREVFQDGRFLGVFTVNENGAITCPEDKTKPFKVGVGYKAVATLLSPTIQETEYSKSNYYKKLPFKVYVYYTNSYGFVVGVEEDEKMRIEWQSTNETIDNEHKLTSGKKTVLLPSSFEHSARVSFVQERPYPMEVQDVLIATDFGGK